MLRVTLLCLVALSRAQYPTPPSGFGFRPPSPPSGGYDKPAPSDYGNNGPPYTPPVVYGSNKPGSYGSDKPDGGYGSEPARSVYQPGPSIYGNDKPSTYVAGGSGSDKPVSYGSIKPGDGYGSEPPRLVYPPGPANTKGQDIDDVQKLVRSLEEDFKELQTNIGSATTLCAVGAERLSFIRGKKLTALDLKDLQQNALIELFKGEIKELQHRADAAQADVLGSKRRAIDTNVEMEDLGYRLGQVKYTNEADTKKIEDLMYKIPELKDIIIRNINDSIAYLQKDLYKVSDQVVTVHEFLESRNCEYGFFSILTDGDKSGKRINYKTKFSKVPHVAVSTVGFSAHLDKEHNGKAEEYDVLAIDKYVDAYADAYGFEAKVIDKSKGRVDVKTIYCSYMACQNIDEKFQLAHY